MYLRAETKDVPDMIVERQEPLPYLRASPKYVPGVIVGH